MNEEHNLTEKQEFLQEFAAECNFYGDTLEIFLKRFEPSKASLTDETLAQYIEWGKTPEDGKQKILDVLRKKIYPVLKQKGCLLPDSKQGRRPEGHGSKEIVFNWLWQTKFCEWKSQKNQTPVSSIPDIDWHQICTSRLNAYKQRLLTNPLTAGNSLDFYVPLGLVEPKREQQKRQKDEVNPEEGSRFYQLPETEITKTYTEPNQFFEEVLRQGNSKTKGQRLAIIGEPGAGKTTLLYQISRWILQENLGYPILIRLAEVNQPLRQFLTQNWLRDAEESPTEVSPEWESSFKKFITGGKVYLLLDAVDEMGITSPLTNINQQLAEGWMQGLRVVLTCRLNLWETEKNALRDFDVYRNLDFNEQQIQEFIEQYFSDATQSQELLKQLKEPNQNRVNDLIKNPLRLALLCRTWKRGQKLPETQAGLYQRLVNSHYQWKDEQKPFQIPEDVQKCLHEKLGELAKTAINREQFRFRLEERFVEQYLGKPQRENTLFDWALKLGWLNRVGLVSVEERDSDQAVYAFFHPTFQEYFAALAIKDWDDFLPRNHVNCPVEGKEYRIFQPQWKQVILLWLGIDSIDKNQKENFLDKLISFEDGCDKFYFYRAYFLAAAGIAEFNEYSKNDEVITQLVSWAIGSYEYNNSKNRLERFFDWRIAQTILIETNQEKVIAHLLDLLEKSPQDRFQISRICEILEKIRINNKNYIHKLISVWLYFQENENIDIPLSGLIPIGNHTAINFFVNYLQNNKQNEALRKKIAKILKFIDPIGNSSFEALRELDDWYWYSPGLNSNEIEQQILKLNNMMQKFNQALDYFPIASRVSRDKKLKQLIKKLFKQDKKSSINQYILNHFKTNFYNDKILSNLIIELILNNRSEELREIASDFLKYYIPNSLSYNAVRLLKHPFENEVDLYKFAYPILWQCAQNLTYPKFYQAWHHNTLTPHPEITNNTPVGNTPTVRQLEQQITNLCTQLPYPHLHCIDAKRLQNLNTKSEFVQAFCNRLYQKLLPNETIPKVQNVTDLETEIINLKQQLQTPHLFILLQGDGTPTPEVIDYCDYLTEALHLAWVTPEPLPRLSSQRSFISSQENLLDAVKSWVEENQ